MERIRKKVKHLLDDFHEINRRLEDASEKEQKSHFYMDMIVLIEKIADYIIPKDNDIRKGLGEIMGGKISYGLKNCWNRAKPEEKPEAESMQFKI